MTPQADDPEHQYNRAIALHGNGNLAEAEPLYLRLLDMRPDHYGLLYFLGLLRLQQGRPAEALQFTQRALQLNPHAPRPLLQQALALAQLGRLEPALTSIESALAAAPGEADLWKSRGDILLKLGRAADAADSYERVLARAPSDIDASLNRGVALLALGRSEDALACFDLVLAARPQDIAALGNRGRTLIALDRAAEALADYNRALALTPQSPDMLLGRGAALLKLNRTGAAAESFDRVLALRPDYPEAFYNRAEARTLLDDPAGALQDYDSAIALKPDYPAALVNKAIIALEQGDFAAGWSLYEARQRLPGIVPRAYRQPLWLGAEDIAGKTLFVHHEQGLGDTLQFCRYAQLAQARGIKVILSVQDRLVRLLRGLSPSVDIIGSKQTPAAFDFHTALLSLPLAFGIDPDTIPAAPFYLRPEPALVEKWKARMDAPGFKVGIVWQGDTRRAVDSERSFTLAQFAPLAQVAGVRLISLQKNAGAEQLAELPPGMAVETLGDFDSGADAFVDTAAVMRNLDLVIAPDTSIAHLAGALGCPVWLALPYRHDWRWFRGRDDTPWYPATRLFRQSVPGGWQSLFARMAAALTARSA